MGEIFSVQLNMIFMIDFIVLLNNILLLKTFWSNFVDLDWGEKVTALLNLRLTHYH